MKQIKKRDNGVLDLSGIPQKVKDKYGDLPMDLWPREPRFNIIEKRLPPGVSIDNKTQFEKYFMSQILEDFETLISTFVIDRGLIARTVAITTTPTLIVQSQFLQGTIILNPATTIGLTTSQTIRTSTVTTTNGNTQSSSLGVANFNNMHVFLDVSAVSGTNPNLDVYVQALDPESGNWVDTQLAFPTITSTGTSYADLGSFGIATNFAIRWEITGTNTPTFTFSVGAVLKDGVLGTASGLNKTVYIGGSNVTVVSGFPLLEGQSRDFFLRSNVELWGVAESTLSLRIFELA